MNTLLDNAENVFLDSINRICNKYGLNNIMVQLYAILYLSNKAMSLDDMVERLKISKGSASINIRALERYNMVRRVWVKGSRKDYYEAETDIYKVIVERAKSMFRGRLSEIDEMLNASTEALNNINPSDKDEKEAMRVFRQRLDKLRNLQEGAHRLFSLFDSKIVNTLLQNKIRAKKEEFIL